MSQFDKKREELLDEIRDILTNAEELFDEKSKSGEAELKKLKEKLSSRVGDAKEKFASLQEDAIAGAKQVVKQTDEIVQENPYKAIGVAGVIGLLLGVLVSKR
ncbi:transmembrane protein [Lonepinella sp. MS14437]